MATMKSLRCKTFSSANFLHAFISRAATGGQRERRADTYVLKCWVWLMLEGIMILSCKTWYELRLCVSIRRTSVHWRALCVACSCVLHCTVAVWLLPVSCTLFFSLLPPGEIRISTANSFQRICLPNGKDGDSVISVVSSLSDLAQCCVGPTPPYSAMPIVAVALAPVATGEDVFLPRSSPFWLGCWWGVGREGGSTVWGRTPLCGELSEEMPEEETLRPWSVVTAPPPLPPPPPPPPSVFTPGSAEPREECWYS